MIAAYFVSKWTLETGECVGSTPAEVCGCTSAGTLLDISLEASQRVQLFNHRRSDVELVADMLRVGGLQTAIMYGANLSYAQVQKYLRQLSDMALIESVEQRNGRALYSLTGKGQKFLELIERMEVLLEGPSH